MLNKWLLTIVLTGLLVLLVGCGVSNTEAEQVVQVTAASPEGQQKSNTPAVPVSALTDKDVQRITLTDAKALLDGGTAVLIDARSAASYSSKHAAGAISLPEEEVDTRADELPTDKALIFYCS